MINPGREVALGGLERVVSGKVDVQEEHPASVGRVVGAHDSGLPMVLVFLIDRASGAVGRGVLAQVDRFL